MRESLLPLSILALAAAIVWSTYPQALADEPTSVGVDCVSFQSLAGERKREEFMEEQIGLGRVHFVSQSHQGGGTWVCAW